MAGDWIKMRRSLLADPKVVRIASALNADRFRTIGGLFSAWCLLDEQTIDGRLEGYSPKVFDDVVGIDGICEAMAAVGWIEIRKDCLVAVDFSQHNGQTAKRRAQENVRKMSARDADKKRTKSGTREEKRREDNISISLLGGVEANQVDEKLLPHWARWCEWTEAIDGRPLDAIRGQAIFMELLRRGTDKAIQDIDFSIQKGAKSILDSDADFEKHRKGTRGKEVPPQKPPTPPKPLSDPDVCFMDLVYTKAARSGWDSAVASMLEFAKDPKEVGQRIARCKRIIDTLDESTRMRLIPSYEKFAKSEKVA